jgi:hypothetical protein
LHISSDSAVATRTIARSLWLLALLALRLSLLYPHPVDVNFRLRRKQFPDGLRIRHTPLSHRADYSVVVQNARCMYGHSV